LKDNSDKGLEVLPQQVFQQQGGVNSKKGNNISLDSTAALTLLFASVCSLPQ